MNIKLFVATPMYGGQCYGAFMLSIMALKEIAIHNNWDFHFTFISNESLITRARNKLVEQFLATDFTHLLFIDADIEFNAHLVSSLVRYDVDVVCGVYPKKFINWDSVKDIILANPYVKPGLVPSLVSESCVNYLSEEPDTSIPGLVSVKHAGTGCMLITRTALNHLSHFVPKFTDYGSDGLSEPKIKCAFFDTAIEEGSGAYLSEDYYFCNEWRKIGGKVYLAYNVKLKHIGSYTFS